MNDGLNIRWRQTAPDRRLVAVALAELDLLHQQWPDTLQCDIVIEPAGPLAAGLYKAQVEIDFGLVARARGEAAEAVGVGNDVTRALRAAFGELHQHARLAAAA